MSAIVIDYALKQIAWEQAKAQLKTLRALHGSYPSTDEVQRVKARRFAEKVKAFIEDIEDNGLHE